MRSNITTTPAARATSAASSFAVQEPKPKETAVGRLMRELHARGLLDGYRPRRAKGYARLGEDRGLSR